MTTCLSPSMEASLMQAQQQAGLAQACARRQRGLPPQQPYIQDCWMDGANSTYNPQSYGASFAPPDAGPPPEPMPSKPKTLHNCTFHELLDKFQTLLVRF